MNSSLRRRGRAVSRVDSRPDRAALTGPAAWFVRFAGLNSLLCPLGFGAFTIPAIVSVAQGHGVLYTFGNPTYSADRFGVATTVPLLAAFLVACLVQLAGAGLLIWLRPSGFAVLAAGMLLSAIFWWGFDLPLAWLNTALDLPYLVAAFVVYRRSSRNPSWPSRPPT
jgi:hypothetical protein